MEFSLRSNPTKQTELCYFFNNNNGQDYSVQTCIHVSIQTGLHPQLTMFSARASLGLIREVLTVKQSLYHCTHLTGLCLCFVHKIILLNKQGEVCTKFSSINMGLFMHRERNHTHSLQVEMQRPAGTLGKEFHPASVVAGISTPKKSTTPFVTDTFTFQNHSKNKISPCFAAGIIRLHMLGEDPKGN